jgi:hypothetical protein
MTEPNPWSRDGAAGSPRPQPNNAEPSGTEYSAAWPAYPAAPDPTGYDRGYPGYDRGYPGQADPTTSFAAGYTEQNPHAAGYPEQNPYPQQNSYPTSYPGPNPYAPAQTSTSPYGPSVYGSNPYAAGPYGYTAANHPQAVAALVLGVVGLVICSYVGIAAFIVGGRARKEILAQPQRYSGLGMATAGWVMGIVGIILAVLTTLFFVIGLAGGWDS